MILSLDVGTTAAKSVLFSSSGKELLVSEESYPTRSVEGGGVEQDGETLRRAVLAVLTAAAKGAKDISGEVLDGMVISSQGGSTLFCDEQGETVAPVVTWLDGRAASIVESWMADGTAELFRRLSGWTPQPGLPAPVLAWFGRNNREVLDRSSRIVSIHDWLVKLLTGNWITSASCASEMLLVNRSSGGWDRKLCHLAGGIDPAQLSRIASSFDQVGQLLPGVAEATGLPRGLAVINGGQDHSCEAYAVGMTEPGSALLACGTAWVINVAVPDEDSGGDGSLPPSMDLNYHIPEGVSVASTFLGGYGAAMEWWIREIWAGGTTLETSVRKELFAAVEDAVAPVPRGSRGLRFDPVGIGPGKLEGLTLAHGRGEMTRAFYEGVARRVAEGIALLEGGALEPRLLWMIGGATRSRTWPAIIAEACGIPVKLFDYSHGPALGAAMIAAQSLGLVSDHREAMERFAISGRRIEPGTEAAETENRQKKESTAW